MQDDKSDAGSSTLCDESLDDSQGDRWADLFGDFSVLGGGVQIVLDGRTVTGSNG